MNQLPPMSQLLSMNPLLPKSQLPPMSQLLPMNPPRAMNLPRAMNPPGAMNPLQSIVLVSPINILYKDVEKWETCRDNLKIYENFLGIELYSLMLTYKFFVPSYFLRIVFSYHNFSPIFGQEVINNINHPKYDNVFVYMSNFESIEAFMFQISMIDNNILTKIINDIRPFYNQIFKL